MSLQTIGRWPLLGTLKTLERLILRLLRLEVKDDLCPCPLQFAVKNISHLEESGIYVTIILLDFSGVFTVIPSKPIYTKTSS